MGLLTPIWLWGLTGLMVPVAIHFLSRKDIRIIQIGSLRHLEHSTTRQAIRIHLHDYFLLVLRCLIVALLAVLLSGLFVSNPVNTSRWLVVENGLERSAQWRDLIDSLKAEGYELRRLQPGFPALHDDEGDRSTPDYWSLALQLNHAQLNRCVVISRDRFVGFSGHRAAVDGSITWLTASPDSMQFVLAVNRLQPDTVAARIGRSDATGTVYESIRMPAAQANATMQSLRKSSGTNGSSVTPNVDDAVVPQQTVETEAVEVVVSGTNISTVERRVVEAALSVINENSIVTVRQVQLESGQPLKGDWLIWLSSDEPPVNDIANVIRKSSERNPPASDIRELLIPDPTDDNTHDIGEQRPGTPQNVWLLTRPLSASTAIREQFTLRLATLLLGDANRQLTHEANRFDQRIMSDEERFQKQAGIAELAPGPNQRQRESGDVLAVVITLLFIMERFIANRQQL